jgi:pimeloyl-ACP methyl ester carboxylesterase
MDDVVSGDMGHQFRTLVRHFFERFFDVDSTTSDEAPYIRIVQLLAVLAIPGLLISFFLIPDHPPGSLIMAGAQTEAERLWLRIGDRYVFVAYAMMSMGLLMVFKWDSLFPDRRDYLILTALPISSRRWFAAKIVALSAFLSLFVVAVNLFSLLIIPAVIVGHSGTAGWDNFARAFAGHACGTIAGSIFAALFFIALQGVLINVLPARIFRRLSPYVQAFSIFVLVTVILITPLIKESIPPLARSNQRLLDYVPMIWFLGAYESLLPGGTLIPQSFRWAHSAMTAIGVAIALSVLCYWVGYYRYSRKILETPEFDDALLPSFRAAATKIVDWLFLRNSTERGTFHFIEQISARSGKHRILTALYTAIATALALSSLFVVDVSSTAPYPFRLSSAGSLEASLILTFVLIAGLRATFNVPCDTNSNWIFRTAGVANISPFLKATQKWVFLNRIAPLFVVLSLFEFSFFDPITAVCHLVFDSFFVALLFEAFFLNFNKVPFTSTSASNKLQMVVLGAGYLYGFTLYVEIAGGLKGFVTPAPALDLARSGRMTAFACTSIIVLGFLRKYQTHEAITYVDGESELLDISSDSAYWNAPRTPASASTLPQRKRIRRWVITSIVFLSATAFLGAAFEKAGSILDRRAFPRVGQSFDVGGRSMNISCQGTGSPTVLLETDVAVAGYSWLQAQRQIAKFARACWYDRAGYGWSDSGPFPNHSDSVARDLHNLLTAAHLKPPYILVGHGIGAFHVRVYNGLHPDDVAGMVLVDPLNEDTTIHVHNHDENLRPAAVGIAKLFGVFGILRLIAPGPGTTPTGWTSNEWNTAVAMAWKPESAVAHIHEGPLWISGELARSSGHLRDLPLIILSAEKHAELFRGQNVELELDRHEALARQSIRARHTIVAGSGYWNPYKAPQAVVAAVRDVLTMANP